MDDLVEVAALLGVPAGVFWAWHVTADRAARRRRMLIVLVCAGLVGMILPPGTESNRLGGALLVMSPGVLPALALGALSRVKLPLPEALLSILLAFLSLGLGVVVALELGLIWI